MKPLKIEKALRVAIVDDSIIDQRFISDWLRELPFITIEYTATNAYEFFAKQKLHPNLDLVLIDYYMPLVSGIELISRFEPNFKRKCLLLSSGYPGKLELIKESGVGGFSSKRKDEIILALKHLVRGMKYFNELNFTGFDTTNKLENFNDERELSLCLSVNEIRILNYIACGFSYKEIAENMAVYSDRTIETYAQLIRKKVRAKNNSQLVKWACLNGVIYSYDDLI